MHSRHRPAKSSPRRAVWVSGSIGDARLGLGDARFGNMFHGGAGALWVLLFDQGFKV